MKLLRKSVSDPLGFSQDYWSHYNKGLNPVGHIRAMHEPDNPYAAGSGDRNTLDTAYMEADRYTKEKEEIWYLIWDTDTWWKL